MIYFEVNTFSVCLEIFCSYPFYTTECPPHCFQLIAPKNYPIKFSKMKQKNTTSGESTQRVIGTTLLWRNHPQSSLNTEYNTEIITQHLCGLLIKISSYFFPFSYLDVFQWAWYDICAFSNCLFIALLPSKFYSFSIFCFFFLCCLQ